MGDIQNITITSTQTIQTPKPHTVYVVSVFTPTRTWTANRRYNDFLSLHDELKSSTGKEPPGTIPGKHMWSLTRSVYDEKIIRERRVLLEQYLRNILNSKDPRWRSAYGWSDFLSIPQTKSSSSSHPNSDPSSSSSTAPEIWNSQTWLTEQQAISSQLRSARSSLLKRDALAGMSDVSGSRTAGVEVKRILREIGPRLDKLEIELNKGLKGLVGEGEKKRREEMVDNLKVERSNLMRMAEAGVRTGGGSGFERYNSPSQLQSNSTSSGTSSMPGGMAGSLWAPANQSQATGGRVFGVKSIPQETEETRPLDDRQLLQLQQSKMGNQDEQLTELSRLLQRQRKMGEEIHQEIGEQNEMLDDLDKNVDKTGGKLGRAKRELNKLGK